MEKAKTGKTGEEKAEKYLKNKKYKILEKNYRCLYGEIDIIAEYKKILVIVEVKYRKNASFGKGYEAVGLSKQQKIIKTTEYYINKKKIKSPVRFDVISIDNDEITHIENAFGA